MTRDERITWAFLGALFAYAMVRASALAWVADDAFISFRYAENLLAGHGLVYNVGERVEGYTNLLWTLLLAAAAGLGADPLRASEWGGIACYAALAATLAAWSWRRRAADRPFLPLAAALVLVADDFHVWATGGLETMLFVWLSACGLLLTRARSRSLAPAWLAGAVFGLLVLTRPDGLLLAAAGVASALWPLQQPIRLSRAAATAAPVALVLAVLAPWKLAYYGELLPTAFYAKSAAEPYLGQGLIYLGLHIAKNAALFLGALAALVIGWRSGVSLSERDRSDAQVLMGSGLLFTAYIVWVGGDFMAGRRLLPVVPLLLVPLEGWVARWPSAQARLVWAGVLCLTAALPLQLFGGQPRIAGIGDERAFYPPEAIAARRNQGAAVGSALRGTPARVAFEGGMCVFGYYSELPYLVEITGLTQYELAKRPIEARGSVGHEKVADDAWLRDHGVHLLVTQAFPPVSRSKRRLAVDEIYFGNRALGRILLYDPVVMEALALHPEVDFVPIERTLELSRQRIERASHAEAEQIYDGLDAYYFRHAGESGAAAARELRALVDTRKGQ